MKTAVIYARYSSERQTEQSIEGQIHVCNEYAEHHDIKIVGTYIDRAMSGTNDNRADFQRMLKDSARREWDYVLVYKLDRFSRNKYETTIHKHTLRENGVKLLSAMENIPDTPEGIILESLLEGMNQYYSAELSQKVKRGMRESRNKGYFTGGHLLYGYKIVNKKIVIEEDEANVVKYIYEQYLASNYVKDIVADLNARGISNRGKPFLENIVYKMLKCEKYTGIYRYGNEVYTELYPQIISRDLFEQINCKLKNAKDGRHSKETVFLLRKKMICGYCGEKITSDAGTSKHGIVVRYYKCYGRKFKKQCNKQSIRKDVLEEFILSAVTKVLTDKEILATIVDGILGVHKERDTDNSVLNLLEKEKRSTQTAIDNLMKAIESGIVTNSTKLRLEQLESKLQEIECNIIIEKTKEQVEITKQHIIDYIKKAISSTPQLLIFMLIKQIVLFDDKIEIYFNYTDQPQPDDENHRAFCFYTMQFEKKLSSHKFTTNRVPKKDDIIYSMAVEMYV